MSREINPPVLLAVTKSYLGTKQGRLKNLGLIIPRKTVALLVLAAKTRRLGLCRPFCFVNRICNLAQMQFSAVSFMLSGGDTFVAFRGTDDTLVGSFLLTKYELGRSKHKS